MILVGVTNYNKQSALPLLLIEDLLSSQCFGFRYLLLVVTGF